jgi:hypothetical protein
VSRQTFRLGTSAIAARANVTAETLIDQAESDIGARDGECAIVSCSLSAKRKKRTLWPADERAEVGAPGEFDAMSDDELLAAIRRASVCRLNPLPS